MGKPTPKTKTLEEYRLRRLESAMASYIAEEKGSAAALAMVMSVYFETEIPMSTMLRARRAGNDKLAANKKQADLVNNLQPKTNY